MLRNAAPMMPHVERALWLPLFDMEPMVNLETMRRILREARDRNGLLLMAHDPMQRSAGWWSRTGGQGQGPRSMNGPGPNGKIEVHPVFFGFDFEVDREFDFDFEDEREFDFDRDFPRRVDVDKDFDRDARAQKDFDRDARDNDKD